MKLVLVQIAPDKSRIELIEIAGITPTKKYPDCMMIYFKDGSRGLTKKANIIHIYSEA